MSEIEKERLQQIVKEINELPETEQKNIAWLIRGIELGKEETATK